MNPLELIGGIVVVFFIVWCVVAAASKICETRRPTDTDVDDEGPAEF